MAENADYEHAIKSLSDVFHDNVVVMQAAWIEWRRGRGAEAAMQWIHNTLVGPGMIPDEEEPYADDAQRYFDLNRANPWPACEVCGVPSHIMASGKGFCSDAHADQWKATNRV